MDNMQNGGSEIANNCIYIAEITHQSTPSHIVYLHTVYVCMYVCIM